MLTYKQHQNRLLKELNALLENYMVLQYGNMVFTKDAILYNDPNHCSHVYLSYLMKYEQALRGI